MGRGAGRGMGQGRRRRRIINFLQPCLLLLLARENSHGYNLLTDLESFGFDPEILDPSLVYRNLRDMESLSLVQSEWDDESQGPQRRMYQITPQGRQFLQEWIHDLERTQLDIQKVLTTYHNWTNSSEKEK
jgi:poly-beta-hydroxybutyrate-responsive repressor